MRFSRRATKPLRGPYRQDHIDAAKTLLLSMEHKQRTVQCAEIGNTPLWQNALASVMDDLSLLEAERQGSAFISKFKAKCA